MFETTFDRMMYPAGFKTTMAHGVRRWKHLPPLMVGQSVTIKRLDWRDTPYGPTPRVLVETEGGQQRWIDATNVEPCMTGNESACKRLGQIAEGFFARRD